MTETMRVRSKKGTAEVWRFKPGSGAPPGFDDRPMQGVYWAPSEVAGNPAGRTWLVLNLPTGPKDVNEGDYVLRFEDGSYDVLTAEQFTVGYEVVPDDPVEPGDEQIAVLASRLALLAATHDAIIAALRDRGDKNMADMLDNAWFIAFGDAPGRPRTETPQGGGSQ